MSPLYEIKLLIESSQFLSAYNALASELSQAPSSKELLNVSHLLSRKIRSKCMDLACNKATDGSREAMELESLLQKVIKLNGEGIYG
ncbi:hypothetical protein DTO96_102274 [Ephemeroptericola cinctiostellae]|uniref:Uncharacterized protein n=1 Tax=Ephemeroptericola cinctiostellae TaxID=2268024 RepID=A0A345DDT1_9BURK|nr:hypothetical protein DTO96_102274 [Ephemeroptericola cinctiostellae]